VLASASAWAVRPAAASARAVEAPAVFLPAWSRVGDHRCSPSAQEGCPRVPSSAAGTSLCHFTVAALGPRRQNQYARVGPTSNTKCLKSPHASAVPHGGQAGRSRRSRRRVPVISLLSRVRLTAPSRGRPASGPPLTSNVRCAVRRTGKATTPRNRASDRSVAKMPRHPTPVAEFIGVASSPRSARWSTGLLACQIRRRRAWPSGSVPSFTRCSQCGRARSSVQAPQSPLKRSKLQPCSPATLGLGLGARWPSFSVATVGVHSLHLTPPSRGRPASGPPLTSNVRHEKAADCEGAPLHPLLLGAGSVVSVGCPSFGGQRTGRGGSSRTRVSLGTCG
jgi:hypothetical protein